MQAKSPILNRPLRVMHIISGDLWAGAESQAFTLLKHLHASTSLHVVLMNEGELYTRLEALQIPLTLIPESHLSSIKILARLTQIIRTFKPDVLHTHRQKKTFSEILPTGFLQHLLKSAHRQFVHPMVPPEFVPKGKQKIQVWLDNWVGNNLQEGIIAVSSELAEKLRNIFPISKIHVIPNGVDTQALLAEAEIADFRHHAPNHKHIGIIGRIEPVKRIDIFIDMANLLLMDEAVTQALAFHIIGDGSLRKAMEEKVNQLGLGKSIFFLGHRKDMASCISSLDTIVMCSDHEGTPMIALEALALGTPLIAHQTGGLIDVLKDAPEQLVLNHSSEGYSAAVRKIIFEPKFAVRLNPVYSAVCNKESTLNLYKLLAA